MCFGQCNECSRVQCEMSKSPGNLKSEILNFFLLVMLYLALRMSRRDTETLQTFQSKNKKFMFVLGGTVL